MKLQDLRAAIRGIKGNPSVTVDLVPGMPVTIVPQKTALLKALGDAYGDSRTAETGLTIDPATGVISVEGGEDDILNALADERQGGPFTPVDLDEDDLL